MTLSTEALLMLVALGLYIFDSSLFLANNEAALLRVQDGRWVARFGLDRWRLGGKEPYIPNPATPHCPLFKLHWRFEDRTGQATRWYAPFPAELFPGGG